MTENQLRFFLLIIGLLILAGIYIYSRWRSQKQVNDIFADQHREQPDVLLGGSDSVPVEPTITDSEDMETEILIDEPEIEITIKDEQADAEDKPVEQQQSSLNLESAQITTATSEATSEEAELASVLPKKLKLVVMHLVAKQGKKFEGAAILKALQAHKLRFGEMEIFHRVTTIDDKDQSVFSVANMVKPGTLIPDNLSNEKLPGISFFLSLPAPIDSLKAYDDMLHCIQHMATTLDGDIKDEDFMTLSREKIALQRAQLF